MLRGSWRQHSTETTVTTGDWEVWEQGVRPRWLGALGNAGPTERPQAPSGSSRLPGPGEQQKREPHSTETTVTTGNRELWEQQQGPQSETTVGRERGELGAH